MYFKRLEIQGFKSFADPVTIDLNEGVTCIVGPNGSGKSNISDALRWVVGETSAKQLRGGKMEDVIFAGTASRKPKGMAEVTLVIDNEDGSLPLEYREVAVTRRMYRSGETEYLINGNPSRLRDIKELFMDTGIGVDGYSIIGQGKIADIVSTKPENRREIFEEAAGIVLYKNRKSDAMRKLNSASENLDRVKDIIDEIEGRLGGLKEDSEKAKEFLKIRERYNYLSVNIILHSIEGLVSSVEKGRQELESVQEDYDSAIAMREELEEKLSSIRDEESRISDESQEANDLLLQKIKDLNTVNSRGQINKERFSSIARDVERLGDSIRDAETRLEAENSNFQELRTQEKELNDAKDAADRAYREAAGRVEAHKEKIKILEGQIDRDQDRIIEIGKMRASRKAEIQTLSNYRETLIQRRQRMVEEHQSRDGAQGETIKRVEEAQKRLQEKEDELKSLGDSYDETEKRLMNARNDLNRLASQAEDLSMSIGRSISRKNTIEEMENNYQGYNNGVRALMQAGGRGIIGTVSDLITVPDGYELAVETALGSQLQNIVCEDDAAAKAGVNWLKKNRAGRATFLPISSIRGSYRSVSGRVENAPGFLGIAADKVSAEKRFDEIVDFLLGRVILADTMDNAVAMSKLDLRGMRIVTLDGEVISASGSITGGRYKNATANILGRKKEIEDLEKKILAIKEELGGLRKTREERELEAGKLAQSRRDLRERIQQEELEAQSLRSDLNHARELQKEAENTAGRFAQERDMITRDINDTEARISQYQDNVEAYTKESEDLESQVEEFTAQVEEYQEVAESDSGEINRCRMDVREQETRILGLNELIERVRDTIMTLETRRDDAAEEKAQLEEEQRLLSDNRQESAEERERLAAEKTALEEKLRTLAGEKEASKAAQTETLQRQKENNKSIDTLGDRKYKLEVKNAKNETLFQAQKDKLWNDFEMSYAEALDMKDEDFAITSGNKEAREIRLRMAELGDVNVSAIEEYEKVSKRYEFMTAQAADIEESMKELSRIISNMDSTIKKNFKETFDKVVVNFDESFRKLFGGGTAELRLEDESDPLRSGIEISAQPPGKKLKNINLMSGGEKTLTAVALMFAVLKAKPTPFCILDEVEAALDEANIERFSDYLKEFDGIQFALITHQKATMEHADVLYGITMPEQGVSRVLSLKLGDDFDPVA